MSLGETRAALDAVLREELPLVQDMAAGILAIRTDLSDSNTASLYGETRLGRGVLVKTTILKGGVLAARRK